MLEEFGIKVIGSILRGGSPQGRYREFRLICQGGKVRIIQDYPLFEEPAQEKPMGYERVLSEITSELSNDFYGDIYISQVDKQIVNMWRKRMQKPTVKENE